MANDKKISDATIPRLSLYYRVLLEPRGTEIISSEELANLSGVTAAQVRKDLTYFGQFGIPGKGYQIDELKKQILGILGIDRTWSVVLAGVGNLGSAFLSYNGFRRQGFNIVCAFDNNPRKIGKKFKDIEIQDIGKLKQSVKEKDIKIAILATSANSAQEVLDLLVEAGVKAVLNFSPIRPQVPEGVLLLSINLAIELERLAYFLTKESKIKQGRTFFI